MQCPHFQTETTSQSLPSFQNILNPPSSSFYYPPHQPNYNQEYLLSKQKQYQEMLLYIKNNSQPIPQSQTFPFQPIKPLPKKPSPSQLPTPPSFSSLITNLNNQNIPLYKYINSLNGSHLIQKLLSKISPSDITLLISKLSSNISSIMTDKYGNYCFQKLIQNCSPEQRLSILSIIKPSFHNIACHTFGTHSLQLLVELANMDKEYSIISECIYTNFKYLACDQRGTHIVQKFICGCSNTQHLYCLYEVVLDCLNDMVSHQHGVCVLIKLLKFGGECNNKEKIIELIIGNALELIQNPFGNYVIQHLLNELYIKDIGKCSKIIDVINMNLFSLSMQKFSSNVVETSLRYNSNEKLKGNIVNLILSQKISSMLKNTYGTFVIEKMIGLLDSEDMIEIMDLIKNETSLEKLKEIIQICVHNKNNDT